MGRIVEKSKKSGPIAKRGVLKAAQKELLYYGRHLCEKLVAERLDDIIRVYCTEESLTQFSQVLRWCAQHRKAYHVVTDSDLARITQSVHHEGVAILARAAEVGNTSALLRQIDTEPRPLPLLILDGVQNPHNIGTIMRVMASFGWPALIGSADLPALSPSAARMSEGGSEYVQIFACKDLVNCIKELKRRGYRLIGSSSHSQQSLYAAPLPSKSVFVLGSEVHGMSEDLRQLLDEERAIPGTGQVESLNVAVACGLLLGEYTRLHGLGQGRKSP